MKKFFKITLIAVAIILIHTIVVYADMSAPVIKSYTAYISNVDGAYIYENSEDGLKQKARLDYGTEFGIATELEIDGIEYGMCEYGFVKISDIATYDEIGDEDIDWKNPCNLEVLADDGVEMYNGPAYGYGKKGVTLQKGTKITGYMYKSDSTPWYYTEYNGNKGWISVLYARVGLEKDEERKAIMTPKDTAIYKDSLKKNQIGTIPANTVVSDYMDLDGWTREYYVRYNGISGFVDEDECAFYYSNKWSIPKDGFNLYKTGELNSEILVYDIPKDTVLESEYETYVKENQDDNNYMWFYTQYNGYWGWVLVDSEGRYEISQYEEQKQKETEVKPVIEDYEEDDVNTIITDVETESPVPEAVIERKKLPLTNQIVICVFVAVIIGITGVAILLILNKKKKVENNDNKNNDDEKNNN